MSLLDLFLPVPLRNKKPIPSRIEMDDEEKKKIAEKKAKKRAKDRRYLDKMRRERPEELRARFKKNNARKKAAGRVYGGRDKEVDARRRILKADIIREQKKAYEARPEVRERRRLLKKLRIAANPEEWKKREAQYSKNYRARLRQEALTQSGESK